jgi:hypothetical protein
MSSITLDATTVEKLRVLGEHAELRDPQGNIIGFFRPVPQSYGADEIPALSEDEVKQCFSDVGRLTTEEVIRRLKGLQ